MKITPFVVIGILYYVILGGLASRAAEPKESDEQLYPRVAISKISEGHWVRPRAEIKGKVTLVKTEPDGDIHFRVDDADKNFPNSFIVCEIIPELLLKDLGRPRVGTIVIVRGVVRFDGEHKWWELHPVTDWGVVKK